jgi:heme ABC exporter ATP-binding subunit CcmA
MDPVVRLCSAVAMLGRFPALTGVDLVVAPGEVVLLRGANGAGKTTLLRVLAGLVPVSSGTAEVLGCDLRVDRRSFRPQVGLLGHATFLYDDLDVFANLRFWARAAGRTSADAELAFERLGIESRLRRVPVARLSAGQRRRVAIATVVARRPRLWLLDEPHAGLDAGGRDLLDGVVREAVDGGATVVFASHELDRATALAGRQVTVAGGRVLEPAPPAPVVTPVATGGAR